MNDGELLLIGVYSYWKVYIRRGRRLDFLGTSRLIKTETKDAARERIAREFRMELAFGPERKK